MATKPTQFRLTEVDLAKLDFIVDSLGLNARVDAVRVAVTASANRLGFFDQKIELKKKSGKKSRNPS